MRALRRFAKIAYAYTLGRNSAQPSTADFWYRQAYARVTDEASLARYRAGGLLWPEYFFDQTVKLGYRMVREDGVPILCYGPPIGDQVNPEAAFQYILGLADHARSTGAEADRAKFLAATEAMLATQTPEGGYPYHFDYFDCKSGWTSALAQARGVSVMVRAWKATGDLKYLDSAQRAIALFDVPVTEGGYLAIFEPEQCPFFEEYPEMNSVVMNGFLSTAFGLWELAEWAEDEKARQLLDLALDSLEKMLPHFVHDGWTVYDLRPGETRPNPHSAFYHVMVVEYMKVLSVIAPRPAFTKILSEWQAMDTPINRAKATIRKIMFKVAVR